jgi:hypothetical protein
MGDRIGAWFGHLDICLNPPDVASVPERLEDVFEERDQRRLDFMVLQRKQYREGEAKLSALNMSQHKQK